jgi:hypothetical protein
MGVDTIAVLSQWWAQELFFICVHPFNPRSSVSKKLFASSAANQGFLHALSFPSPFIES